MKISSAKKYVTYVYFSLRLEIRKIISAIVKMPTSEAARVTAMD